MSNALVQPANCNSPCADVTVTQVPGPAGADGAAGAAGTNGANAFTLTTIAFVQPASGATVDIDVADTSWVALDQFVFVDVGGIYTAEVLDATHLRLTNLGYNTNAAAGVLIPSTSKVSPSGPKGENGATSGGDMLKANNLSDLTNFATARSNLGLGTMALQTATDYCAKADNLSGLASPATARTNLGLAIGTNVQPFDAFLASLSLLGTAADKLLYTNGVNSAAESALTALARTLLANATAPDMRETLGSVLPRYGVLGFLKNIDANVANNDNNCTIESTGNYRVDKIMVCNPSVSMATVTCGVFTAPAGGGIGVAADQAMTGLTAMTKFMDLTLGATPGTDMLSAGVLYIRTGTALGAAGTFDAYVLGWRLD